jgi:methionyl-tRNA synthetase
MQRVLIDLNRNLVKLSDKFTELVMMVYDKQVRKLIEKFISSLSKRFFDIFHAVERLNIRQASGLILEMLDEADAFMDDVAWRIAAKPFEKVSHLIRELLQVIRSQVIFVDQYVQSHFAF